MMRLFLGFVAIIATSGCTQSGCDNTVRAEIVSPDGKERVVLFSRDCGATTDFNTQASVLKSGESLPDEPGNLFIVDKGTASVSWSPDGHLLVRLDRSARVFKKQSEARGVRAEYHEE